MPIFLNTVHRERVCQRCCWNFKSPGLRRRVDRLTIADLSKSLKVTAFRIQEVSEAIHASRPCQILNTAIWTPLGFLDSECGGGGAAWACTCERR